MIKHLMGGALIALSITGSLAAVFILDRPTTNTASTQPVTVKQEPQVLFYDGFDDTTLNSERWTNCFPGNNCTHEDNKELQCYTAENVKEIDRMLTITAKPQNAACNGKNYGYTSGLIQTDGKFSFKYGYLEVRAKTPPGQGLWSTVWLLAADHNFPPELDPLEQIGQFPDTNFMGVHYQNDDKSHGYVQQTITGTDLTADFHTYGMDWREGSVKYYLDGKEVASYHNKWKVPSQEMYILINLAVGGSGPGSPNNSTPFPAKLEVDYIKVTK